MEESNKILKPGTGSTEYKNSNMVIFIGAALLLMDKLSILSIHPGDVQDLANTLKTHVDEYLGAALVFGTALSYRLERVFLKYQEFKTLLAKIEKANQIVEEEKKE